MTAENLMTSLRRTAIRCYEGGLHRRPVFRYWRELEASQWWPPERVDALQFERLRRLLQHAQATSPWYGAEWQARGLDAREVRSVADFHRWPVIDRGTIKAHRPAMRSTAPPTRLIPKATGGSSGVPLLFDIDAGSYERRNAAWHRGYNWAGAGPGTRQWYLWGVAPVSTSSWKKRKMRLYDGLYRRTMVSCFDLSEAALGQFLESLGRTRPHAIVSYTNAIYTFARMLEARGWVPSSPGIIVVGAEKLYQFQREVIERVFRAPVFETYGSREFMLIGAECTRHNGLHLTAENLLVELLDDDGVPVRAGTEGNVVVTDLTNFGMPFIRYANGDRAIAAAGPCGCGRGLPTLAQVTGRRLDMLTTPDGRSLPGEFFPHILKDLPTVQRFQVVQAKPDTVTIRVVAPGWTPDNERWLRHEIAAVAGTTLNVDLELVADIPLTAAGKLRVVINEIADAQREEPA